MSNPSGQRPQRHRQRLSVSPDDPRRSRLFPRGTLAGLALIGAATLALMWPGRELMQLLRSTQDTSLAIDYLKHLLRLQGGNADLRLLLAQRYMSIGRAQQALAALEPLGADPRADAMRLRIWQRLWFDARARGQTAQAQRARGALVALLAQTQPRNFDDWRSTLLLLQGLDDKKAIQRLAPMALRYTPLPTPAALETSQLLLGLGEYRLAAQVLFASLPAARTQAQQRALLQRAARVLLASGDAKQAYAQVAAHARDLPSDPQLAWELVRLALAADRPQDALAWLGRAVDLRQPAAQLARQLDAAQAELAWRLMLASTDLNGALHIADAALAAPYRSTAWARRRAQVLEWNNQPDAAMHQWMALLRQRITQEALSNVRRLAGNLHSSSGLIAYWEARARTGGMTAGDWLEYAQALENQGHPQQAVAVLRKATPTHPSLLGPLAWLQGNMGETDASLQTYAKGLKLGALDLRASIDYALALLQAGQFQQARDVLAQTQQARGTDDLRATHQGLLADIDWDLGDTRAARAAYASAWNAPALRGRMKPYQVERFIVLTQQIDGPAAALALLPKAWEIAPTKSLAMDWLQALVKLPSLQGLQDWTRTVFAGALGEELKRDPQVFAARSQVWQALGRRREALADLRAAVRLAPDNRDDQIALLWLLLDMNRLDELRTAFKQFAPGLQRAPGGLEVQAAVAQALGDLRLAVALSQRLYPRKRLDTLWLVNYGDLLTRAGHAVRAQAAYDQAWRLLRRAPAAFGTRKPHLRFDDLLAALRLSYGRAPRQAQQHIVAALRARLRSGAVPAQARQQMDAAIADWLLHLDTTAPARWWLARAVLTRADRQSVELQVALQEQDREQVRDLLDAGAARALTPIDRVEALRAAGRPMQALRQADRVLEQAAEQGLSSPALEALARQTAQDRINLADRTTLRFASQQTDAVMRQGPLLEQNITLAPGLRLSLHVERDRLSTRDASAITGLPPTWTDAQAGLSWKHGILDFGAKIGRNTALGSITPLELTLGAPLPGGMALQAQAQRHTVADESGALLVAGRRDRLAVTLTKTFGRFWASVSESDSRYATRLGSDLGTGRSTQAQAGVWLRQGEPDLALKVLGYSNQFAATGTPEAFYARLNPAGVPPPASMFIPAGDDAYGLGIALNQLAADRYSSHWLPFGELDLLRSRRLGNTTGINLGVQGPVFGGDQLSLQYQRQQDTTGLNRQWSLQYRIWFGP